jgi:hypothetical protein
MGEVGLIFLLANQCGDAKLPVSGIVGLCR